MKFEDILNIVKDDYENLKKKNCTNYSGKVEKAVKGTLTSNKIFEKTKDNEWKIRDYAFGLKVLQSMDEGTSRRER